jgi:hypothetical protein
MWIPPLLSHSNPTGPVWATAQLSPKELGHLLRRLVMFVGRDPQDGRGHILGSGFIVAVNKEILVLSAAHIFVEWADKFRPPAAHAFRGVDPEGDAEDFRARFMDLLLPGNFQAVADLDFRGTPRVCTIGTVTLAHDYRRNDTALVQLRIPDGVREETIGSALIDTTAFYGDDPVLMVGFTNARMQATDRDEILVLQQEISAHAGYVVEAPQQAEGYRGIPMYRANMPSLGGMSGGPAFVTRPPRVEHRIISAHRETPIPTAVGIVSRSRLGRLAAPALLDHNEGGETWISPIEATLGLNAHTDEGPLTLSELIRRGVVRDYNWFLNAGPDEIRREP